MIRAFRNGTVMAIVVLTTLVIQGAEPATKQVSDVFVGYVSGRAAGIKYELYTHLCHAFVVPAATGELIPRDDVPDAAFVAEAHRHGVRVLLSVGGWGHDARFAAIVLDQAAESRFVEGLLRIVDQANYDGIDLDWEYPDTRAEIAGFERVSRRLRSMLDALAERKERPMELTMASSAHPHTLVWLTDEFLLETMDWVNVMTYDYAGGWAGFAGHHAPFEDPSSAPAEGRQSVRSTFDYLLRERGLPPERLAIGLPLYGRAYSVAEPYAETEGTDGAGRALTYRQIRRLLADGWRRSWDAEARSAWLTSPEGQAVLGYDDAESIRLKTDWAKAQGLRGVFFWEASQDRLGSGDNPLQEAAKGAWRSEATATP